MAPAERERLVADWNSPDTEIHVCVLNVSISSAGLNLHGNCSRGIIATTFWNVNTMIQTIGRLIRIGQKAKTTWHILRVNGTIWPWMDRRMYIKVRNPFATYCRRGCKI